MTFFHALRLVAAITPVVVSPSAEPVIIETPCITVRGADPTSATLQATVFSEKLKELRLDAAHIKHRITRAEVYRFVGRYGEALCTVELLPGKTGDRP